MLKLIKTPSPQVQQVMIRMSTDALLLSVLNKAEIRGIYDNVEAIRDKLSQLLDKADGK
jgi:hypothetical protein